MTAAALVVGIDDLAGVAGTLAGPTPWLTVGADEVAAFRRAARDAASAQSGVPPLMLLALTNRFLPQLLAVEDSSSGVNYGTGPVRFAAPVPVGSRLRGRAEVVDVAEIPGGYQATVRVTEDVEGRDEPACVAETISRYLR